MSQTAFQLKRELLDLAENYEEFYSIDPNTSYFKRFPTCQHVQDFVCADQSCYSKCPQGAYGEKGGQPMPVPWEQCSRCRNYLPKD